MLMFCFNVASIYPAFIFYPVLFYCKMTLGDLKGAFKRNVFLLLLLLLLLLYMISGGFNMGAAIKYL